MMNLESILGLYYQEGQDQRSTEKDTNLANIGAASDIQQGRTGTTPTGGQFPDMGYTQADAWTRPDWFRDKTQSWTGWEKDYGGTPTGDQWFRDPSWGGHAIYNPEYGFQNYTDIGDFYQQQGWGADLSGAGLTPQMGSDWASYGFTPKETGGGGGSGSLCGGGSGETGGGGGLCGGGNGPGAGLDPREWSGFPGQGPKGEGTSPGGLCGGGQDGVSMESSCFLWDTMILTGKNEQREIQNIEVGDRIISYNEKTKSNNISRVIKKFSHNSDGYLVFNGSLRVTSNHPVLLNDKWAEIGTAQIGDTLKNSMDDNVVIKSIEKVTRPSKVYNLEVEDTHTYYADGILAHNKMYPSYGENTSTMQPQEQGEFQYPQEWGTASDVLSRFAMGLPTQIPESWQQSEQYANRMAQTGMPTTAEPWFNAMQEANRGYVTDEINQAVEQAGLGGMRYSTSLGRQVADIGGRRAADLGGQYAGLEFGAQEAARGRQMSAIPMLQQQGMMTTGLTESAKNRGMQSAGMLGGLGQMYADLPRDTAMQAMQMSGLLQQLQQQSISPFYQEALRGMPENSPWLQLAMQAMGMPSSMATGQYAPSGCGQFLGSAAPFAGVIPGMCGGGS